MSRSYKSAPVRTGRWGIANQKRIANKKVRKEEEIPNGRFYQRVYDSTNIIDFTSRNTLESLLKQYETDPSLQEKFPTESDLRKYWKLNYITK